MDLQIRDRSLVIGRGAQNGRANEVLLLYKGFLAMLKRDVLR